MLINDPTEIKMIENHRKHLKYLSDLEKQRKTCKHDWKYDGHSHNEDSYMCRICGEVKYV